MNVRLILQRFGIIALIVYMGVAVFGITPMAGMDHGAMGAGVGCPYSSGMQSICDMGTNHIRGWQMFSQTIISDFFSILALILAFGVVQVFFTFRVGRCDRFWVRLRRRNIFIVRTIYQELFSRGILNPKNP